MTFVCPSYKPETLPAWHTIFAAAVVGLERPFYTVSEDEGMVEVCAIVTSPDIMCPIEFPFQVNFSTTDGTAGVRGHSSILYTNIIIKHCKDIRYTNGTMQNTCVVSSALDYYRELTLYIHAVLQQFTY